MENRMNNTHTPIKEREYIPNFGSDTWLFVAAWATKELERARKINDLLITGPEKTIELRSRIKLLKEIINTKCRGTATKNTPAMNAGEGNKYV